MSKILYISFLVEPDELTASPESAIQAFQVYSKMNIVNECPTSPRVVIYSDTVGDLKFSLIPVPKEELLINHMKRLILCICLQILSFLSKDKRCY